MASTIAIKKPYRPEVLKPGVVHQEKTDAGIYLEAINQINDFTINTGVRVDRFDFKAMDGKRLENRHQPKLWGDL